MSTFFWLATISYESESAWASKPGSAEGTEVWACSGSKAQVRGVSEPVRRTRRGGGEGGGGPTSVKLVEVPRDGEDASVERAKLLEERRAHV